MDESLDFPSDSQSVSFNQQSLKLNLACTTYIPNTLPEGLKQTIDYNPLEMQSFPSKPTTERQIYSEFDDKENPIARTQPSHTSSTDYRKIMMSSHNCEVLLEEFLKEPSGLRMSDACSADLSFKSCLLRAQEGYAMTIFDYPTSKPGNSHLHIDGYGIFLKRPRRLEIKLNYEHLGGVLLGTVSSTFKKFFMSGGSLKRLALEENDCFSIVTSFGNLDFATHSDLAKYDVLNTLFFYLSARSQQSSPSIVISHIDILKFKVARKIQDMAHRRYMTSKELILLAILKSLVIRKASPDKINTVKEILNKSFRADAKIYRLITRLKPANFVVPRRFRENFDHSLNSLILARLRYFRLYEKRQFVESQKELRTLGKITQLQKPIKLLKLSKNC